MAETRKHQSTHPLAVRDWWLFSLWPGPRPSIPQPVHPDRVSRKPHLMFLAAQMGDPQSIPRSSRFGKGEEEEVMEVTTRFPIVHIRIANNCVSPGTPHPEGTYKELELRMEESVFMTGHGLANAYLRTPRTWSAPGLEQLSAYRKLCGPAEPTDEPLEKDIYQ
ncbi:MAG: hypothetical protein Q9166_001883 [cf. Caloplaca sp. 2 TL-2023]